MRYLRGGRYCMGSDAHYPEEGPAHMVEVNPFWMDETPVTNAQFARFVEETGWVTMAEQVPDPADYPGILPEMLRAGSLVFTRPAEKVQLHDFTRWWSFSFGASWRHPQGPGSNIDGLEEHPVVHIAHADGEAYATWAGKVLPTEAEWEYAARGGLDQAPYAWGDELAPGGAMLANYWQGQFPSENRALDGFTGTSPVRAFPANQYGLFDMIGNVWEWTGDWYADRHAAATTKAGGGCCIPLNPRGAAEPTYDPCQPEIAIGRKVLKGGSHLCAENYCRRYRPAARYAQPIDTSTSHVGFRCAKRSV